MKHLILFSLMISGVVACAKASPSANKSSNPACGVSCSHGNEQGNGSDYIHEDEGYAWFLNSKKTIHYCVNMASSFGVDKKAAESAIEEAFARWRDYIHKKKIFADYWPELQLTTNAQRLATCDGKEDLTFYLGLGRPKGILSSDRVAATVQTSFDPFARWGKGLIWVTSSGTIIPDELQKEVVFPDWAQSYNLAGILTHELGHVYGNDHVEGTIMAHEIANAMLENEEFRRRFLGSIDGTQELKVCYDCMVNAKGSLGIILGNYRPHASEAKNMLDTISRNFKVMTGHDPKGSAFEIEARLVQSDNENWELQVSEGSEKYAFPIKLNMNSLLNFSGQPIFRRTYGERFSMPGAGAGTAISRDSSEHDGISLEGTLQTAQGTSLPIVLTRNLVVSESPHPNKGAPLMISYLDASDSVRDTLFFTYDLESKLTNTPGRSARRE